MLEPGGDLDLAEEALGAERGGQLRPEDLDRDLAAVLQVLGEIHVAMPPTAELALDRVAVGEGSPELLQSLLFQQINHRNTPRAGRRPPASLSDPERHTSSSLGMAMSVAEAL